MLIFSTIELWGSIGSTIRVKNIRGCVYVNDMESGPNNNKTISSSFGILLLCHIHSQSIKDSLHILAKDDHSLMKC